MSNKEFFNILVVTGKLPRNILKDNNYTSMGEYRYLGELIQIICESDYYVGNIYTRLMKLNGMTEEMTIKILSNIVIKMGLGDKEVDVLIERLSPF